MTALTRNVVTGYISSLQEERFRLTDDQGQTLLLTLGNAVGAGPDDILRWYTSHTHLRVEYTGEPNLVSGVAVSVKPI